MANLGAPIIMFSLILLSLALEAQVLAGGKQQQLQQSMRRPSPSPSPEEYAPVKRVVYRPSSSVLPPAATATATAAEAVSSSYEPFELCEGCRCCLPSNASSCLDTSCCYAIDCNLPGKPFGTCAFTPHSCGCGGATGNCTQPS